MKKKTVFVVCAALLSLFILIPVLSICLPLVDEEIEQENVVQTYLDDSSQDDSNVVMTEQPDTETNGTIYTLTIFETISFTDSVVISTVVISSVSRVYVSSLSSEIDDLRERRKLQFFLKQAKMGLLKVRKKAERFLKWTKHGTTRKNGVYQHPASFYILQGLPTYPRLLRMILMVSFLLSSTH